VLTGYPLEAFSPRDVDPSAARALPRAFCEEHCLLAVQHSIAGLIVATSEIPRDSNTAVIRRYARQGVAYLLVTPPALEALRRAADSPVSFALSA
jgi:hypothetical protein